MAPASILGGFLSPTPRWKRSWLIVTAILSILGMNLAVLSAVLGFDMSKIRQHVFPSTNRHQVPQPASPPSPITPSHLASPPEYTLNGEDDTLCHDFYTEAYLEHIATHQRHLCPPDAPSIAIEFDVPTHPHQAKLRGASPVYLVKGATWDAAEGVFRAQCPQDALQQETSQGYQLIRVEAVQTEFTGECGANSTKERPLVVFSAYEEDFGNVWHRLMDLWQAVFSFDAVRMAVDPDRSTNINTVTPHITEKQAREARIMHPAGQQFPTPWADLWRGLFPSNTSVLHPADLPADNTTCYDVLIPTVGWASPFWSALLKETYETCRRETLLSSIIARTLSFFKITPRSPTQRVHQTSEQIHVTIVQRSAAGTRKIAGLEPMVARLRTKWHPRAQINVVDMGSPELSLADQMAIAARSDVYVGVHGAAFMHVLWMAPEAAVVELLPPSFTTRGFRWVCLMRGLVHFARRTLWKEEYEYKVNGTQYPGGWRPAEGDGDWQTREWIYIPEMDFVNTVDAAIASQIDTRNDLGGWSGFDHGK